MVLRVYLVTSILIWTGISAKSCNKQMFDSNVQNCLSVFNQSMQTTGYHNRCPWPNVKRIYNELKHCVDNWANTSWCRGQGFVIDEIFLDVHLKYFGSCGQVHDPSLMTLIMLIAPVIIATLFLPLLCIKLATWDTEMPSTLGL